MKNKYKINFLSVFFIAFCLTPLFFVKAEGTLYDLQDTYVSEVELPFKDEATVPNFAREAIKFLYDENIMSGNSDGNFAAHRNIVRAEFAKIVIEATDTKKYVPLSSIFPDVGLDDWFFPYVETGRILGWWGGYPNGLFKPGNYINRAEIAKVLVEAFDLDVEERSGEGWYEKYFRALSENGLLAYGTTMEDLGAGITPSRAEVAEQVFRFRKYKSDPASVEVQSNEETIVELETEPETEEPETTVIEEYTPPTTQEVDFEYVDTNALTQQVDSLAGKMYIEKVPLPLQKIYVDPNQPNIEMLKLKIRSSGGVLKLRSLQVKISGNGTHNMLSRIWIEEVGAEISERINPQEALVTFDLKDELVLQDGESTTISVMANVDVLVNSGNSIRAALFLPTWISANTNKKIGFFPFSGSDVIVK